ncbi:MAG: glycosyltransferase [Bradymonadia bacterium]|jgi:cellulose synthase/poly-beta-1,6-N-acetylglucosamine synthase-like glycosyltransferase
MGGGFDLVFVILYFAILGILGFYGVHRYVMATLYRIHRKNVPSPDEHFDELPKVTIQLPMFNERYVVERLIDAVCEVRYPREKLQIQVLDDSTDDTVDIARRAVERKAEAGYDIVYLHRENREGYKAGALEEGLMTATGEFVAVFDADFVPQADFLEKTIHFFTNENVGMVQVRWEHLNREYSLLTRVQAILLDGHFVIEHTARNRSGRFFNFNGTAGIWRKATIGDAGGWQHDTITEDLDLSYRAQSKGWRFVYINEATTPAEVPVEMIAFKTQQHRWAKGSIQVAKKLLGRLLTSKLPFKVKLEAFMHLTNNIAYCLMVILSLMMPMAVLMRINQNWMRSLWVDALMFFCATLSIMSFYLLAQREARKQSVWERLFYLPIVMSLGIGLCVNNTRAVLEALFGYKTGFVRTPKYGVIKANQDWRHVKYRFKINWQPWVETAIGVYFIWGVVRAIMAGGYASVPFLMLFGSGFLYVGLATLLQRTALFTRLFAKKSPAVESSPL